MGGRLGIDIDVKQVPKDGLNEQSYLRPDLGSWVEGRTLRFTSPNTHRHLVRLW